MTDDILVDDFMIEQLTLGREAVAACAGLVATGRVQAGMEVVLVRMLAICVLRRQQLAGLLPSSLECSTASIVDLAEDLLGSFLAAAVSAGPGSAMSGIVGAGLLRTSFALFRSAPSWSALFAHVDASWSSVCSTAEVQADILIGLR